MDVTSAQEIVKKKVAKRRFRAAKINLENVDDVLDIKNENVGKVKADYSLDKKDEVQEKETNVFNENIDKTEVFDVEECEENNIEMKFIDQEIKENLKGKKVEGGIRVKIDKINHESDDEHNGSHVNVNDDMYDEEVDESFINEDERMCSLNEVSLNDELMHKQVLGGDHSDDEVVKGTDALTIVPLLQAILVMMLVSVKTFQDQSVLIARLSDLSQCRMSASFKPVAPSSSLQCSCLTQSRKCWSITTAISGKVTGMANIVSTGMIWCRQVSGAINCIMQNVIMSMSDFISTDYSYEDFVKRRAVKKHSRKVMI